MNATQDMLCWNPGTADMPGVMAARVAG